MKLRSAVWAAVCLVLCGCVTVFPKTAPEQLYRFGGEAAHATPSAATPQARVAVQALPIDFNRSAAGDLILTVSGSEVAYIKGARWVGGASSLFEQALATAFDADQGGARLMARGEAVRPDYFLKLDVRTFEARYVNGQGAAPTIVVEVYAALSRPSDRSLTGEHTFTVSVPASENRVSAIAAAFDQAVGQVLGQLVKWVDSQAVAYSAGSPA